MRLLLDTHIALWAITDDRRLSRHARELIGDPQNESLVSVASLWEIAIKHARIRGAPNDMPVSAVEALQYFRAADYAMLDIASAHVLALQDLPWLHGDPFDRMLLAQAVAEPLRLLTHDRQIQRYGHPVIAV